MMEYMQHSESLYGQQPRESKAWKEAQVYLVGMAVQECVDGKTELDNIRFVG